MLKRRRAVKKTREISEKKKCSHNQSTYRTSVDLEILLTGLQSLELHSVMLFLITNKPLILWQVTRATGWYGWGAPGEPFKVHVCFEFLVVLAHAPCEQLLTTFTVFIVTAESLSNTFLNLESRGNPVSAIWLLINP